MNYIHMYRKTKTTIKLSLKFLNWHNFLSPSLCLSIFSYFPRGHRHRGCDRMVVGLTTTYAICAYHHWCCGFDSRSGRCVQHYVIQFVSNLRQLGRWFSPGTPVSSTNKTDRHGYNWNIIASGVKHHKTKSNLFSQAYNDLLMNIFLLSI